MVMTTAASTHSRSPAQPGIETSVVMPSSTASSVTASSSCSVTSVPTAVGTGMSTPRAISLRRSTETRATSPSRANSTVFSRKPMKIAGIDLLQQLDVDPLPALLVGRHRVQGRLPGQRLRADRRQVGDQRRGDQRRVGGRDHRADRLQPEPAADEVDDRRHRRRRKAAQQHPPARLQLRRQLRHGDELEAELVALVDDLRQRLDGLRAVAAVARIRRAS